ncbi:hypothetical protein M91_16340, partial [Bos mutus]
TENFKNHHFEGSSSLTVCNNELFLYYIVMCNKSGFYMTTSDDQHFPKSNLHQKKVMVTVWLSAAHLIHYSFLNPGKTITSKKCAQQIDEMHRKLQHLQLALVNRKGPILHDDARPHITQPTLQKLNELGY